MALIAIAQPRIVAGTMSGNSPLFQQPGVPEKASQDWLKNTLVQITGTGASARLQRCAADATAIYGLAPMAATTSGVDSGSPTAGVTNLPPASLHSTTHYPFNLRDVILEINISNGSLSGANIGANGVTYAGGGTGGVALAPGQQYGLITLTSGTYNKYQMLDVTETTAKVFEIVQLAPSFGGVNQTTTDNNPRVWVKILPAALQG